MWHYHWILRLISLHMVLADLEFNLILWIKYKDVVWDRAEPACAFHRTEPSSPLNRRHKEN